MTATMLDDGPRRRPRHDGLVESTIRENAQRLGGTPWAADFRLLRRLIELYGARPVAQVQADTGLMPSALLDVDGIAEALRTEPADTAQELADAVFGQGCVLLLTVIGQARDTGSDHAGIDRWRALLVPVIDSPWAPYGDDLIAAAAGDGFVGRVIEECRRICRERAADHERATVATEIRRLVAESGLSQRDFAAHVGTSASRLSTYVTGGVTPSAAMLVRMRQVSLSLAGERQAQPARRTRARAVVASTSEAISSGASIIGTWPAPVSDTYSA